MKILSLVTLLVVLAVSVASAQTYAMSDIPHRAGFALGFDRHWYLDDGKGSSSVPLSEWSAGGYATYDLMQVKGFSSQYRGQKLSLAGSLEYPWEVKKLNARLGLRWSIYP